METRKTDIILIILLILLIGVIVYATIQMSNDNYACALDPIAYASNKLNDTCTFFCSKDLYR